MQLARLAPPIAYNFILIEKYVSTQKYFEAAYENTYGTIQEVPVFGDGATKVLPIFIVAFVLLNVTNFYSNIMNCLGLSQFTFGSGIVDENKVSQGKKLIE